MTYQTRQHPAAARTPAGTPSTILTERYAPGNTVWVDSLSLAVWLSTMGWKGDSDGLIAVSPVIMPWIAGSSIGPQFFRPSILPLKLRTLHMDWHMDSSTSLYQLTKPRLRLDAKSQFQCLVYRV
jgi:hypothetical protein